MNEFQKRAMAHIGLEKKDLSRFWLEKDSLSDCWFEDLAGFVYHVFVKVTRVGGNGGDLVWRCKTLGKYRKIS